MSSILTNTSAMVALQTMRGISRDMADTQNQIATGMKVGSAKDNAATWAISRVMESDVQGFRGIQESLSLGESTVSVARQASETVTGLLTEMKGKIVAAQEENVDRAKIQTDIEQLREQIDSVVSSAQFNGLNLVDGSSQNPVNVLSSLDRSADGTVSSSNIAVNTQNLTSDAATFDDAGDAVFDTENGAGTITDGNDNDVGFSGTGEAVANDGYKITLSGDAVDGDPVEFVVVASGGESQEDISNAFLEQMQEAQSSGRLSEDLTFSLNNDLVNIDNATGESLTVALDNSNNDDNAAAGGLNALDGIDVSTQDGAEQALQDIEGLIQFAIDSAAGFGSAQARIEIQNDFVGNLIDSLNTGIGTLVDADMEEQSARLQALQVQQQLATQSLSIANSQPQNILALFG